MEPHDTTDVMNVRLSEPERVASTVSIGNAGEHLLMAELLARGFQAFMADRGNPAFDIAVDVSGSASMIRVKTTRCSDVQWSAKKNGEVSLDRRSERDFVAIVDLRKGVRSAMIYLVPTVSVEQVLAENHAKYLSHPKSDGSPRKDTKQRIIHLDGVDRPTNEAYGYSRKWEEYREAWWQLGDPSARMAA